MYSSTQWASMSCSWLRKLLAIVVQQRPDSLDPLPPSTSWFRTGSPIGRFLEVVMSTIDGHEIHKDEIMVHPYEQRVGLRLNTYYRQKYRNIRGEPFVILPCHIRKWCDRVLKWPVYSSNRCGNAEAWASLVVFYVQTMFPANFLEDSHDLTDIIGPLFVRTSSCTTHMISRKSCSLRTRLECPETRLRRLLRARIYKKQRHPYKMFKGRLTTLRRTIPSVPMSSIVNTAVNTTSTQDDSSGTISAPPVFFNAVTLVSTLSHTFREYHVPKRSMDLRTITSSMLRDKIMTFLARWKPV